MRRKRLHVSKGRLERTEVEKRQEGREGRKTEMKREGIEEVTMRQFEETSAVRRRS